MKIPNSIKVGANIISITKKPLIKSDEEHNGGWFDWESNQMFIATDMPEDRTATCFLHEILHAMNMYLEEQEVTFLSESLIQVIRDNNLDFRKEK